MDNQHKYLEIAAKILTDPNLTEQGKNKLILELVGGLEYTLNRFKARIIQYQETLDQLTEPIEDMDPSFREVDMN